MDIHNETAVVEHEATTSKISEEMCIRDRDLTNPNMQISLSEAQKIDASYEEGEEVTDEVIFAKFGRRAILNLRQTLASKILELERCV